MGQAPIKKKTGFSHLIAAATYSAAGARRLLGESAFRHELIAFVVAMAIFTILGASLFQYVAMAILFLLMIAFEALNTAIEVLVDQLSPGWSAWAKEAKDLGSLAVACVIGLLLTYAAVVLIWLGVRRKAAMRKRGLGWPRGGSI